MDILHLPVLGDNHFSLAETFRMPKSIFHQNCQNVKFNDIDRIGECLALTEGEEATILKINTATQHFSNRFRCKKECSYR